MTGEKRQCALEHDTVAIDLGQRHQALDRLGCRSAAEFVVAAQSEDDLDDRHVRHNEWCIGTFNKCDCRRVLVRNIVKQQAKYDVGVK